MIKKEGMVDYHAYIRINDIAVRLSRELLLLSVDLTNVAGRPVCGVTLRMKARNGGGEALLIEGEAEHTFSLKDLSLEAGMRMNVPYRCRVEGIPAGIEIEVEETAFLDGVTAQKQKPHKKLYYYKTFDVTRTREKELQDFLRRHSEKAVCFAEKRNDGWLCACGRLNRNRDDKCPECLSNRKEMLTLCTKDAITEAFRKERGSASVFSLKRGPFSGIMEHHTRRRP